MPLNLHSARTFQVLCPAVQAKPDGTTEPLDPTGKVFWVRQFQQGSVTPQPIPDSSVVLATPAEIAGAIYDGDKTKVTWLKATLPGGENSFATAKRLSILVYAGSAEGAADTVSTISGIDIVRIALGEEGLTT